jgi:uncharacterized protein (TIGR02145 family)
MKILSIISILLIGFSCITYAQTVTIGTQVWTNKNLDVAAFRNGDLIPQAKTVKEWQEATENKQPAWCNYNNDSTKGAKYGKLYNWYAVSDARGLAPEGYHIPTNAEWLVLCDFLGGKTVAGKKMKSTSGWDRYKGKKDNGTNEFGFSGLPGGGRNVNGLFYDNGVDADWWSSTEGLEGYENDYDDSAKFCGLISSFDSVMGYDENKGKGLSVRCLKD